MLCVVVTVLRRQGGNLFGHGVQGYAVGAAGRFDGASNVGRVSAGGAGSSRAARAFSTPKLEAVNPMFCRYRV